MGQFVLWYITTIVQVINMYDETQSVLPAVFNSFNDVYFLFVD